MATPIVQRIDFKLQDGDLKKASAGLKDVDKDAKSAEASAGRLSSSWKTLALRVGSLVAALGLLRGAFRLLSDSVRAAGIQQIAEQKLAQAIRNTGAATAEWLPRLKAAAAELQRFSNFGDESIITAQALLLSFREVGGPAGAELLTRRLADVAAGLAKTGGEAVDLNTVAQALGRALTGGVGALTRYGVSLTEAQKAQFETAKGMERVQLLAEILDDNFRGLAEVTADPFVQLTNAVGDAKEAIGSELRPELAGLADDLKRTLQDPATIQALTGIGRAVAAVLRSLVALFGLVNAQFLEMRGAIQVGISFLLRGVRAATSATAAIREFFGAGSEKSRAQIAFLDELIASYERVGAANVAAAASARNLAQSIGQAFTGAAASAAAAGRATADFSEEIRGAAATSDRTASALQAAIEAAAELRRLAPRGVEGSILGPPARLRDAAGDLEKIRKGLEGSGEAASALAETLEDIGAAVRSMTQFVELFGDLSDEARNFAQGVGSALDNLGRLTAVRAAGGGLAAQALPFLGLAAGIGTALSGIIGALSTNSAQEAAARREQIQALRELREALEDNAREISRAVRDFVRQTRVGFGVTGVEAETARGAFEEFTGVFTDAARGLRDIEEQIASGVEGPLLDFLQSRLASERARIRRLFDAFLSTLEDLDIEGLDIGRFRQQFEDLLEAGVSAEDAVQQILDLGLDEAIRVLVESFGGIAGTVDGAITAFDIFQRLLGQELPEAFRNFIAFLLDNVEGLSDDLTALLEEAQGLDLTTAEGRARIAEISQIIVQALLAGQTGFLQGLTPEEAQRLAEVLLQASESLGAAGGADTSATFQVQRAISEVQANAVVRGLDVIAFWTRRTAEILAANLPVVPGFRSPAFEGAASRLLATPAIGSAAAGAGAASSRTITVTVGDISVVRPFQGQTDDVRAVALAIEEAIRRKGFSAGRLS